MPDTSIDASAIKTLMESTGGDPAFLAELIDVYIENATRLLTMMRDGIAGQLADQVRLAAHSLKSNSANFGASELVAYCRELEEQSRAGNLTNALALVARIESQYVQVKQELLAIRPAV